MSISKVGMIGSSYITGRHLCKNGEYTPLFIDNIRDNFKGTDIEFFSNAQGGKGSEIYLNAILNMKKEYDIDHIIMEWITDRAYLTVDKEPDLNPGHFEKCWAGDNIVHESFDQNKMKNFTTRTSSKRIKKQQRNFLLAIDDIYRTYFFTMINLRQAIDLCHELNISITACMFWGRWTENNIEKYTTSDRQDSLHMHKDLRLKDIQPQFIETLCNKLKLTDKFMHWNEYEIGYEYFAEKYGLTNYLGKDETHLEAGPQKEAANMISAIIKQQIEMR